MSTRDVIRRINEELYGEGRVELVDELIHPEFVDHTAPEGFPPDREGQRAFVQMTHGGLSDTEATMDRIVVEGDQVAWRWTMRGTHTGELMGVPASGNRIELSGNDLGVMRDGKLAELWSEIDMMSLMTQLGALEQPAE